LSIAALGALIPDWPAPPGVLALCSTREGGVSLGPYASLNLGDHVGDVPAAVAENRARLQHGLQGARPVFLNQVHATGTIELDGPDSHRASADACFTTHPLVACTIMVADCLPVLFCNEAGTRVAAAHAGWRGLAAGVLESALSAFAADDRVMAWLGPCIGPAAFEVGSEVKAVFEAHSGDAASCFRPAATEGKWFADLSALARRRLQAAGIASVHGNDGTPEWCTVGQPSRFFSHRRDGVSGRFAACVWRA